MSLVFSDGDDCPNCYIQIANAGFDETYFNYAVASSSASKKGIYNAYPLPGREIMLSVSSKF